MNNGLIVPGIFDQPLEWLLFSEFAVGWRSSTFSPSFMVVPIFNSMIRIDRRLIEAAYDAARRDWLADALERDHSAGKAGIVIGSIFVITIVMGDFITIA